MITIKATRQFNDRSIIMNRYRVFARHVLFSIAMHNGAQARLSRTGSADFLKQNNVEIGTYKSKKKKIRL